MWRVVHLLAMKYVRFIPVVLAACLVALLVHFAVTGGAGYPAWMHGWTTWMGVAAAVLGVLSVVMAVQFKPWHERSPKPFIYEAGVMFTSVFCAAALFVLAPATVAAVQNPAAGAGNVDVSEAAGSGAAGAAGSGAAGVAGSGADAGASDAVVAASADASAATQAAGEGSKSLASLPGFQELTLVEIQEYFDPSTRQAAEKTALYIGREGCSSCQTFITDASPVLEQQGRVLLAMDTAAARAQAGEEALDKFLDQAQVSSVPVVLVMQNGKEVERITSPLQHLDEIVSLALDASSAQALGQDGAASADAGAQDGAASADAGVQNGAASANTSAQNSATGAANQCDDETGDCAA